MPRLKLTRLVFFVIMFTCVTLLIVNIWIELNTAARNGLSARQKLVESVGDNLIQSTDPALSPNGGHKSGDRRAIAAAHEPDTKLIGNYELNAARDRPWFMLNGTKRPTRAMSSLAVWPEQLPDSDRIVNQLMYVPPDYESVAGVERPKLKKILLFFGRGGWNDLPFGRTKFLADSCPVSTCELTFNQVEAGTADAIFFKDRFSWPKHRRPPDQVWILFLLECPLHTQMFRTLGADVFNWTATYRHDSDIVAPYEKFVPYHQFADHSLVNHNSQLNQPKKNYAEGKTKKVAWFVSNCGARNQRLEYARELSKHIDVDIFGSCGSKKCPRSKAGECFDMLNREYKFYLAFENSNCRDYITEKFFVNGLGLNSKDYNLIPIVMGAHPDDYRRQSPPNSYIHVDEFSSPKALAEHLHRLDRDDRLYSSYFDWKSSGEFVNTYFWCRLCALLHADHKPSRFYPDIGQWWSPDGVCNGGAKKWNSGDNKQSLSET